MKLRDFGQQIQQPTATAQSLAMAGSEAVEKLGAISAFVGQTLFFSPGEPLRAIRGYFQSAALGVAEFYFDDVDEAYLDIR